MHRQAFLNKFDSTLITCGDLKHFNMMSTDLEPTTNTYAGNVGDKKEKCAFVISEAKSYLHDYLDVNTPVLPEYGLQTNVMLCRFCNKKYMKNKALGTHEATVHGIQDSLYSSREGSELSDRSETRTDGILKYTQAALFLGL